jgi:hypothetical protein
MDESAIRILLAQHWAAPTSGDIYEEDVVCDLPQSGERIRGRANLVAPRCAQPDNPRVSKVLRVTGSGGVWVSEVLITYDGKPWNTVNIHEFRGDKIFYETQYFAEPFAPAAWRSQWVVRMEPKLSPFSRVFLDRACRLPVGRRNQTDSEERSHEATVLNIRTNANWVVLGKKKRTGKPERFVLTSATQALWIAVKSLLPHDFYQKNRNSFAPLMTY